jgi:hypothetical protein
MPRRCDAAPTVVLCAGSCTINCFRVRDGAAPPIPVAAIVNADCAGGRGIDRVFPDSKVARNRPPHLLGCGPEPVYRSTAY